MSGQYRTMRDGCLPPPGYDSWAPPSLPSDPNLLNQFNFFSIFVSDKAKWAFLILRLQKIIISNC